VLFSILILVGCGGGNAGTGEGNTNPTQGLIDPSGNWALVATDSSGSQFAVSGVLYLSNTNADDTVIGNNLKPPGLPLGAVNGSTPPQYSCGAEYHTTPGSLQLSSGLVQNDNNLLTDNVSGLAGIVKGNLLQSSAQSFSGVITLAYTTPSACLAYTNYVLTLVH
jgi:hypothetical protein